MRTFIFALAAIVAAFAIDGAEAADEVPEFDIARNCKAETSGAAIEGPARCTSDETEAKNQLAKRWSSYSASQKKECVGESTIGGRSGRTDPLPEIRSRTDRRQRPRRDRAEDATSGTNQGSCC